MAKIAKETMETTKEAAPKSKFLSKLQRDASKLVEGYKEEWIAGFPSPGMNYLFGKNQGAKAGFTTIFWGPPKSGKSFMGFAAAGQLHKDDPEAIVLHFDTEYRDNVDTWVEAFGIDKKRFISFQTNRPNEIFDYIANDVNAGCQEGEKIKMIIIDSLASISYPKETNKEVSTDAVMGDAGSYLSGAMKLILPVIRKNKIALILCQHVRANFDTMAAKYNPYIIPGGFALKHFVEYWILVSKVESKDSKKFDTGRMDGSGNAIQTGHTIRAKMVENSMGPQNRAVEVAISYQKGIVDQYEEIANLAVNMGIIEKPNNVRYQYGDKNWQGFNNFVLAVKEDEALQQELITKIKENDIT